MFGAVERWIAGRYLRARRREGFISVIAWFSLIGIALGVATLIIVLSVMNGFRQELLSRILGLNGHVIAYAPGGEAIRDYDPLARAILGLDHVKTAFPVIEGQVIASASGVARGALVKGMRPADIRTLRILSDHVVRGSLDDFGGRDAILIGDRLARRLGVGVGGKVTLISPRGRTTVIGTIPRARAYTVVATFDVGMFEYDSSYVFMPFAAAQVYFRRKGAANQIEVFLDDPEQAGDAKRAIARLAPPGVQVFTWKQAHAQFFNALQVERNVMFLILTMIILVAAFNIISSLIMMVHDKAKGIAILRTMGASRGMITRIFFMTGASVGVLGTTLGVALGLGFAANIDSIRRWLEQLSGTRLWSPEIRFLSQIPAIVDVHEVAMVIVISLGLSFLATFYPAWRAARLDPVEALRYE